MTKNEDVRLILSWQKSPFQFIEDNWGLKPQPLKPEFQDRIENCELEEITVNWFVPKTKDEVVDEGYLTWQQSLVVLAVERAVNGNGKKRISIESGHGTGKSAVLAMLILWHLLCHLNSQVPCTAPTSDQLYDVLWKEISIWLHRMPVGIQKMYAWETKYVRIKEAPEKWFARAKTARKEAPEALAGMHGEHVMFVIDEASGVPEEIYKVAEGALTSPDILVIMVSNHTRVVGYFHESHNSDKEAWQCLSFDSRESPIVDEEFVERIINQHGEDSDEFRIRVAGKAPREEAMDDKGWVPLFSMDDIHETTDEHFTGHCRMGVDAAGEGKDKAAWAVRDKFKARIVATEKKSTTMSMAEKTITLGEEFGVDNSDTWADNFGEGANLGMEIMKSTRKAINGINVGDEADDPEVFENKRAESYWRMRDWARQGGEFFVDEELKKELLSLRYKRNLKGKIQIMGKVEMKKAGLKSPNKADAIMLTFVEEWSKISKADQIMRVRTAQHVKASGPRLG